MSPTLWARIRSVPDRICGRLWTTWRTRVPRTLRLLTLLQTHRFWPGTELAGAARGLRADAAPRHRAAARPRLPGPLQPRGRRRLPARRPGRLDAAAGRRRGRGDRDGRRPQAPPPASTAARSPRPRCRRCRRWCRCCPRGCGGGPSRCGRPPSTRRSPGPPRSTSSVLATVAARRSATASGSGSATPRAAGARRGKGPQPPRRAAPAGHGRPALGTSSRTTSSATTGGPSGWTGSRDLAGTRAVFRPRENPRRRRSGVRPVGASRGRAGAAVPGASVAA